MAYDDSGFPKPDEWRGSTTFPLEGYEQQDSLREEPRSIGQLEVPNIGAKLADLQGGFVPSDLSAYATGAPQGNYRPEYSDLSEYGTKPAPSYWSKINTPAVAGNYTTTPLAHALAGFAGMTEFGRAALPGIVGQANETSKLKMSQDAHDHLALNQALKNFENLSLMDTNDPMIKHGLRLTMQSIGLKNKGTQEAWLQTSADKRGKYLEGMAALAEGGKLSHQDLIAGLNGPHSEKYLKLAIDSRESMAKREQMRELGRFLPTDEPVPAPIPVEVPLQQGPAPVPSEPQVLDPHLETAILGNEGSGVKSVSPKGAVGRYQLMPETARPYLPAAMQNMTNAAISQALKNDVLNTQVGRAHLFDLQIKFNGDPKAVAAAYFSGAGNVNPDGTVINPNIRDLPNGPTGELRGSSVQQYMDNAQRRYDEAAQNRVAGPGATAYDAIAMSKGTTEEQGRLDSLNKRIAAQQARIAKLTAGQAQASMISPQMEGIFKANLGTAQATLNSLEQDRSELETGIRTRQSQSASRVASDNRVVLSHNLQDKQATKIQAQAQEFQRGENHITTDQQTEFRQGLNYAKQNGLVTQDLEMPIFRNKSEMIDWAQQNKIEPRIDITKAGKAEETLKGNVSLLDNMQMIFDMAPRVTTGPLSGTFQGLKDQFHVQGDNNQAVFDQLVNKIFNQDLRAFGGTGISRQEINRKATELLDIRDKPEVFASKGQLLYDLLYRDHDKYVKSLESRNFYVPDELHMGKKARSNVPDRGVPVPQEQVQAGAAQAVSTIRNGSPKKLTPQQERDNLLQNHLKR